MLYYLFYKKIIVFFGFYFPMLEGKKKELFLLPKWYTQRKMYLLLTLEAKMRNALMIKFHA